METFREGRKSGRCIERMFKFKLFRNKMTLRVLCLGSHPDDIEIGCGGTILRLIEEVNDAQFHWVIFSADKNRNREAYESANVFLKNAKSAKIVIKDFREGYFPFIGIPIKEYFGELKKAFSPDIIFTHYLNDAHQDHHLISALTWNIFRDNLIFEYEVPKYDGDLGTPNLFVHLKKPICQRKIRYIFDIFKTQKEKQWFTEETFWSLLRLRGIESNAPSKYAEAFYCRKIVF